MPTLKQLTAALERLNHDFPRPGLRQPLAFSTPYVFRDSWPREEWPNARGPGIYAFLDEGGNVLYIGKASCDHTIGMRLGAYFKGTALGLPEILDERALGCAAVMTVGLDPDRAFEAPAIEEYLIANVPTPRNKAGAIKAGRDSTAR